MPCLTEGGKSREQGEGGRQWGSFAQKYHHQIISYFLKCNCSICCTHSESCRTKRRSQFCTALATELPLIYPRFGGKHHYTPLHSCRRNIETYFAEKCRDQILSYFLKCNCSICCTHSESFSIKHRSHVQCACGYCVMHVGFILRVVGWLLLYFSKPRGRVFSLLILNIAPFCHNSCALHLSIMQCCVPIVCRSMMKALLLIYRSTQWSALMSAVCGTISLVQVRRICSVYTLSVATNHLPCCVNTGYVLLAPYGLGIQYPVCCRASHAFCCTISTTCVSHRCLFGLGNDCLG